MIKTTKQVEVFQASDGQQFASMQDASRYELDLFVSNLTDLSSRYDADDLIQHIVENPEKWRKAIQDATQIKES